MAYFCSAEDVEHFLQLTIPAAKRDAVRRAIVAVTEEIKNYCRQQIELVEDDVVTLDVPAGRTKIMLPELPVIEVSKVVEDGDELVAGSDEDYQLGQYGILHRVGGQWEEGVQILEVTYSHGYTNLPDDICDVATRAVARAYQAGLKADEVEGLTGVQALSLGDYSVQFGSEQAGGTGDSSLGASAAPMLLRSEREMLHRYRA